jgi:hypothetical protein
MDEVLAALRSDPVFELERALGEYAGGTSSVNKKVQDSAGEMLSVNLFFANVIVVFVRFKKILINKLHSSERMNDKYLEQWHSARMLNHLIFF